MIEKKTHGGWRRGKHRNFTIKNGVHSGKTIKTMGNHGKFTIQEFNYQTIMLIEPAKVVGWSWQMGKHDQQEIRGEQQRYHAEYGNILWMEKNRAPPWMGETL